MLSHQPGRTFGNLHNDGRRSGHGKLGSRYFFLDLGTISFVPNIEFGDLLPIFKLEWSRGVEVLRIDNSYISVGIPWTIC